MHLHLMSTDEGYVDCIEKGPHVPMKPNTAIAQQGEGAPDTIPELPSEWTLEDIAEMHKDKKAMNILFNGLETDMFDNVINCTIVKEVWDTVQTLCEGTEQISEIVIWIKVVWKGVSNQRFKSQVSKSLPKEWKPMTVYLRNTQKYMDFTLERLYGTLKTYELEMEQDEEIEKVQKKGGYVALVSSVDKTEDMKEETAKATPSTSACEGRAESSKGKGKMIEENEPPNQDEKDEIDEHLTFLSRRFSKLKLKKNPEVTKPFRKDFQPNKNYVERSKFKCFNCGMGGHFANECRKPKTEKKDRKFELVDYKNKYFELLKQKERTFIT
ncbi:hypothetical protein POM88_040685 [Heracleum sosnowskyi]|uniref:CCHC-type domain-containing protein n=1 Tax=Heracleum sosnowskyi TaxID=360622 RepID=A0AAD8HDE4_9APIA|nr:hypothetical protein POM88_040685 [Heracleum sosnowskyi]